MRVRERDDASSRTLLSVVMSLIGMMIRVPLYKVYICGHRLSSILYHKNIEMKTLFFIISN
jgi:hypothetical protein